MNITDFIKLVIVIAVAFTLCIKLVQNLNHYNAYIKKNQIVIWFFFYYSRSFLFGFRDGSLERNPKVKSEIKKITTVYTKIFSVNIY